VAGRILKEDIEALRHQADIVAVVGDYTSLRRAGKSYKGLCPFHTERSPSFTCSPDGNFFHCFGCGASGDIYDFLQRVEGLDFPEAVETLARRTGFPLRYEQLSNRERRAIGERSRLVAVAELARDHFVKRLLGEEGVGAREYLKQRGFGLPEAQAFGLGYATEAWDDLSRALVADGVEPEDLIAIGVSVRNDRGGLRDRFRARIIFPIKDPGGAVIGFGGRILPGIDHGDFEPPKYLNSPETPLYHKSRVLYGVSEARSDIVAKDQVLVCEGYTDVIALHQAGFANAVATCGTAVGTEHLRALSRYTSRIVLAFDADTAGVKAAERAWEAAREVSAGGSAAIDLSVLPLPQGRDPADLAREVGSAGVEQAVMDARPVVPFLIALRLAAGDLASEQGRAAVLREALTVLGREQSPDLRRAWARSEIARPLGLAYDHVVASASRLGVTLDPVEGIAAPARSTGSRGGIAVGAAQIGEADVRLERAALRAILQAPDVRPETTAQLQEEHFRHPSASAVWRAIAAAGGAGVDSEAVIAAAQDDVTRDLVRSLLLEEDEALSPKDPELRRRAVTEVVNRVLARSLADAERRLRQELADADASGDERAVLELQARLRQVGDQRRQLTDRLTD
jgi:DNA primase